jgi:predicted dehydrogenase
MHDQLKWGVLGNATIARMCVIPAIQKSRNGIVRVLGSRSPQKAAETAEKHHIRQVYNDYASVIEDPEVEAVYIPLPNHLHCEWTLKALEAGKHVLCEKPLACNAQEAQTMADAAQSAGRFLMEGFMYRFHPRSRQIRRLVTQGRIGTVRLVRTAFCFRMGHKDCQNPHNARLDPNMGGGALLDVGCYGVSVARWFYDDEPLQVQCQASYHPNGVDVHITGILKFSDGRLATVEASFLVGLQQTFTVVGERGVIELPHDAFIPWEKEAIYTLHENGEETGTRTILPGANEYQLMVEHFVDAVRGDSAPACSPSDSIGNMRVLDALARAAKTGETINV